VVAVPPRSQRSWGSGLRCATAGLGLSAYHQRFATFAEARTAIFNYIETFYNRTRLHSSLVYLSPINFESKLN